MQQIHTTVDVDAPAETVWAVLTDFERYEEWNPYTRIEGVAAVDERLRVSPGPAAGRAPTFRPRVLVADPGRELAWQGHLFVRGLFDGEHRFRIEDLGGGRSRLVQSETFRGLLVRPIMRFVGADTERNFRGVNEALKARAERVVAGDAGGVDAVPAAEPTEVSA